MVERLWTPWRKAYLEGPSESGCFLCTGPAARDDRANMIVFRGEQVFVILNRYPYNSGHVMVAPYAHTGDFGGLPPAIATELMATTQRTVRALEAAYQPHAFNIGMNLGKVAGAGVPDHLHMHLVPRWNGDTNFMPVIADTKVLPETLNETYERLEPHFRF